MSTPQNPVVAASPAPAKKVSFLKNVGIVLGKVAMVFNKVAPVEPLIAKALEALFPKFAPAIETGDGLFSKIAKQIMVTEVAAASVATPPSGETKLQAVTDAVGNEIDQWIKNLFPGAQKLTQVQKSGIVQSIFEAVDGQPPSALLPPA